MWRKPGYPVLCGLGASTCGILCTCSPGLVWGGVREPGGWLVTPPFSAAESNPNPASSPFPSLWGGAPWPREKAHTDRAARGSGVRPGLGPFDAWAGVGAPARIKRPQSCHPSGSCPAPSASVARRGRLLPQPHFARGVAGAPLNGLKGLFMRPWTLPSWRGLSLASSSPLSVGETVQAQFGSCCSVALPILPAEASPERGEGDGWALQPGASAIRSAPLAEPLGAALWGSGWSLLGVSGRGGST